MIVDRQIIRERERRLRPHKGPFLRIRRWWWLVTVWPEISDEALNRRVDVENVLFNVAAGKRPMLTPEECRALALKLGTPR